MLYRCLNVTMKIYTLVCGIRGNRKLQVYALDNVYIEILF